MKAKLIKTAFFFLFCGMFYCLGRSHAETKIITQKMETIKYADKRKAEIYARPNAGRTALLELMQSGQL